MAVCTECGGTGICKDCNGKCWEVKCANYPQCRVCVEPGKGHTCHTCHGLWGLTGKCYKCTPWSVQDYVPDGSPWTR